MGPGPGAGGSSSVHALPHQQPYAPSATMSAATSALGGGGNHRRVHPRFRARSAAANKSDAPVSRPNLEPPGARARHARELSRAGNPGAAVGSREALEARYGIPRPRPGPRERVVGRAASQHATLRKEKLAPSPFVLPAVNRRDPHAEVPRITEGEVRKYGMYHLAKLGYIPPDADLTEAMLEAGGGDGLLRSTPVRLHPADEAFVKHEGMISLRNPTDNIKLDLATPVVHSTARRFDDRAAAADAYADDGADAEGGAGAGFDAFAEAAGALVSPDGDGSLLSAQQQQQQQNQDQDQDLADGGAKVSTAPARSYDELMDEFSLHHFIIRHGKTITQTPEFESFRRRNEGVWGAVLSLVKQLETLLANYAIPFAYVDGPRVVELAGDEVRRPSRAELVSCFLNADTVGPLFDKPGQRYRGKGGTKAAVTKIQSLWRMCFQRRRFQVNRVNMGAVVRIQSQWRTFVARRAFLPRLEALRREKAATWQQLQAEFRSSWGKRFDGQKRMVIHLNSLSHDVQQRRTMPDLSARQNGQMSRLCDIADPNVEVVYISPFPLNDDLLQYYNKLLQIAMEPGANPSRQYKILYPENHDRFPAHTSLAQLVLYSPRCLARLRALTRGRAAYIQPHCSSLHEVELAVHLGLPLLAPGPETADLLSTKAGARAIFAASDVAIPPGVAGDMYDPAAVVGALAALIARHLGVPRWLLKIDDEFHGRGHAYLDVTALECYPGLVEERASSAEIWEHPSVQEAVARQVREELSASIGDRVVICDARLFRSWRAFVSVFARVGGVIEACPAVVTGSPSVNLFISPDGRVEITSAHDQFFGRAYRYAGALFPQASAPYRALRDASLSIASQLVSKGVIGHVGIDYVAFPEANGGQRLWAVDLNLRATDSVDSFRMFNFVMGGSFDPLTGQYLAPTGGDGGGGGGGGGKLEARTYAVADFLSQPALATIRWNTFFGLLRQRGITFDLHTKEGTLFNVMNKLSKGTIGVCCVGRTYGDSLSSLVAAMSFIQQQINQPDREAAAGREARVQGVAFAQVATVVRAMLAQERELQRAREAAHKHVDQTELTQGAIRGRTGGPGAGNGGSGGGGGAKAGAPGVGKAGGTGRSRAGSGGKSISGAKSGKNSSMSSGISS
jgi:hypothetical protein